jgi:threonine dehydrogenase-like Zn-dependent dehydrogenase
MRAVVFDLSLAKYALAKALGKQIPALYYGRPSCLQLRDVPEPPLRGPEWAKIRVESCGFCGSDLSTILFKLSPAMSPFASFPSVLGHEIFGRLVEVGNAARAAGWKEGDRVTVNPAFGCRVRGLPPCAACASGHPATCHRAGETAGGFAPGFSLGYHRDLPGGFSEALVAHHTQLHRIPDSVPDGRAVLAEPLAIAVHAVLKREPRPGEDVLIIGGGMIAFAVLAALRLLGHTNRIAQLLLLDFQAEIARSLGADEIVQPGKDDDPMDRVAALTGARRHKPILGRDVLTGGFALTFDCVGSPDSVRDALAYTRSQGTVVLVGGAAEIPKLDLSALWSRELSVLGTCYYGPEPSRGHKHSLDLTTELLAEPRAPMLDPLVTHSFRLEQIGEAVQANLQRGRFRSVKTVFKPQERS